MQMRFGRIRLPLREALRSRPWRWCDRKHWTERSTLVLQRVPQCVMTVDTSSVHEASHRRVAKCGAGGKGPQRLDRVFDARSRVEWSPCPLPNVQLHFTRSARRMWKRGPGFPSLPPCTYEIRLSSHPSLLLSDGSNRLTSIA